MTHPSYIVTAHFKEGDLDGEETAEWAVSTGNHAFEKALHDYNRFLTAGFKWIHIRECTQVIDILDLERQAEQPTMDMRDQQVQDLLEQDKQEALARIRAQR